MKIRILALCFVTALGTFAPSALARRGHGHHSSHTSGRSLYVHSYIRANGTVVRSYYIAAPGTSSYKSYGSGGSYASHATTSTGAVRQPWPAGGGDELPTPVETLNAKLESPPNPASGQIRYNVPTPVNTLGNEDQIQLDDSLTCVLECLNNNEFQ